MAIIYVSNSLSNGYSVGDDSRTRTQAQSKSTPVLTFTRAAAIALDNDTIIANNGVYTESNFVQPFAKNLTVLPESDWGVTIKNAGADSRVWHINNSSPGTSFGRIIVDAQDAGGGAHANCVTTQSSGNVVDSMAFHGTWLINATAQCFYGLEVNNVTFDQGWITQPAPGANQGIYIQWQANNNGVVTIVDGADLHIGTSASIQGIRIDHTAGQGFHYEIARNSILLSSANPTATLQGVLVAGGNEINIHDNVTTIAGVVSGQSCDGIAVTGATGASVTTCYVQDNLLTNLTGVVPAVGHGVQIGDDVDVLPSWGRDTIQYILVTGNQVSGFNHGVFVGWQSNAQVQGNQLNNVVIGTIGKHDINSVFKQNITRRLSTTTGGAWRAKACSGTQFNNNVHVLSPGYTGPSAYVTDGSTGVQYNSNRAVANGVTPVKFVNVLNDGSDATFSGNDYYSDQPFPAECFTYRNTNYDTLEAWIDAHETNWAPQRVAIPA